MFPIFSGDYVLEERVTWVLKDEISRYARNDKGRARVPISGTVIPVIAATSFVIAG
jgi:hypothetical protein